MNGAFGMIGGIGGLLVAAGMDLHKQLSYEKKQWMLDEMEGRHEKDYDTRMMRIRVKNYYKTIQYKTVNAKGRHIGSYYGAPKWARLQWFKDHLDEIKYMPYDQLALENAVGITEERWLAWCRKQ